jgi:UDP-glucose 4-epimerase
VGLFLRQKREGQPLTIVGDGQQTRDFTHIDDAVAANILSATTQNEEAFGEVFNIGTGETHSILRVAHMVGGEIKYIEPRSGEARDTLADNSKARKILGWKPTKNLENYIKNLT